MVNGGGGLLVGNLRYFLFCFQQHLQIYSNSLKPELRSRRPQQAAFQQPLPMKKSLFKRAYMHVFGLLRSKRAAVECTLQVKSGRIQTGTWIPNMEEPTV